MKLGDGSDLRARILAMMGSPISEKEGYVVHEGVILPFRIETGRRTHSSKASMATTYRSVQRGLHARRVRKPFDNELCRNRTLHMNQGAKGFRASIMVALLGFPFWGASPRPRIKDRESGQPELPCVFDHSLAISQTHPIKSNRRCFPLRNRPPQTCRSCRLWFP